MVPTRRLARLERENRRMKVGLGLVTVALAGLLFVAAGQDEKPRPVEEAGPRLLTSGEAYAIHMFRGIVEPVPADSRPWHSRVERSGIVVYHTDLATRKSTWLVRTGTYSVPTRRVTYAISRVVGIHRTDKQLMVVRYDVGRVLRPRWPPPEKGLYRVVVFDLKSAKKRLDHVLCLTDNRPGKVPEETTGTGVIRSTKKGLSVFGHTFAVDRNGKITPMG